MGMSRAIMDITPVVSATTYQVEIPKELFIKLCDKDRDMVGEPDQPYQRLKSVGEIYDLEYSMHFGSIIIFTTNNSLARQDFMRTLKKVLAVL